MEIIDEILLKTVKHLDIHSLNSYKKNDWKDDEIVKSLKTVCEPEIKKLGLFSVSKRTLQEHVCSTMDEARKGIQETKEGTQTYWFLLGRKDYAESILMKFT